MNGWQEKLKEQWRAGIVCLFLMGASGQGLFAWGQTPLSPPALPVPSLAPSPVADAADALQKLREDYERLDIKQNFPRYAAFTILQPYMPAGVRFTSGFRSPEEQIGVIRRLATGAGIPPPPANAKASDQSSWGPALAALRAKGFIIASPLSTPHATEEVVFDMSGAPLHAIEAACRKAEKMGLMTFRRIILESVNNAVHVEVNNIGAKALMLLGTNPFRINPSSGGVANAAPSADEEKDQRRQLLQFLMEQHNKETNPTRQIELDQARLKLLDPSDIGGIHQLEAEIKQHEQTKHEIAENQDKKGRLEAISEAHQQGEYGKALELAKAFAQKYPGDAEAQTQVAKLEAILLFEQAIDMVIGKQWDCAECKQAQAHLSDVTERLKATQSQLQGLARFSLELTDHVRRCQRRFILQLVFGVLLGAGLLVGLYFIVKPGQWVLQCMSGPGHREVFPLTAETIIIGATGPPEGEADIVITDTKRKISRRHCVIRRVGRRYYLKDESANGTKVNGQLLPKEEYHRLRKGDEISLADEAELIFKPA